MDGVDASRRAHAVRGLAPAVAIHTVAFMGEEFDEQSPFLFFTDYGDPRLRKAVREGRRNEFRNFGHPIASIPDPQDPATFERSKLNWQLAADTNKMLGWYKSLLALRKK